MRTRRARPYTGGTGSWLERFAASRPNGAAPPPTAEVQEWLRRENIPPIGVSPPSGPAPLSIRARWLFFPVANPMKIEYDVGEGRHQVLGSSYGSGQIEYTYDRPGHYDFTVWVHEHGGAVQRYSLPVEVLAPTAFEADIQSRWDTLKTRLRRGDITGALECIHSASRAEYARVFDEVFVKSRTRVDDVFTSITPVTMYPGTAVYDMLRKDAQHGQLSYEVRFEID